MFENKKTCVFFLESIIKLVLVLRQHTSYKKLKTFLLPHVFVRFQKMLKTNICAPNTK